MQKSIEKGLEFSAVFGISDAIAIGAMRALADAGIKVPDEVSVVGFDGIDNANYYIPRLTTIRQPIEEMAKESINLIFKYIDGEKDCHKPMRMLFEGQLIEGESAKSYTN